MLLVPGYSDIESRSHVDIGNDLDDNIHLSLPVISSPMDTVTENHMCDAMVQAGGMGIIHRYNTIEEQAELAKRVFIYNKLHSFSAEIVIYKFCMELLFSLAPNLLFYGAEFKYVCCLCCC